jgi:hypothetical protein
MLVRALRCFLGPTLLLFALSGAARAEQPKPSAEQEMADGERALAEVEAMRVAGDHAAAEKRLFEALEHFTAAHVLAPEATGPTLGLGLTLAALGRCREALLYLDEYLKLKAEGGNPAAPGARDRCRVIAELGGYVSFHSRPGGALVTLEGPAGREFLGQAPTAPRLLPPGRYQVSFTQEDKEPVTRAFEVEGGEDLVLTADVDRPKRSFGKGPMGLPPAVYWASGGAVAGAGIAFLAATLILR